MSRAEREHGRPSPSAGVDERSFRRVMGRFATGVTVVTTVAEGEVFGMTANAFMAVSLHPPLCAVSVGRAANMHAHLAAAGFYGVSFLGEDQQHLSNHFAGRRLVGLHPEFRYVCGAPVLAGALAVVVADLEDAWDCGDHTFFIGRTRFLEEREGRPLVFYGARYAALDRAHRIEETQPPAFW
ncbi:MAG TPA: flavin reductase family protein [Gammaproteobacteria bacterium]|nr:flavin reductase family protein [Gammaproteobacteria bacterium]